MTYKTRVVDQALQHRLRTAGAVVIEGARGCGKTSTGMQAAASSIRLDSDPGLVTTAQTAPQVILDGPSPRMIDEWQLAPGIWNALRHEVDQRQRKGQFIISGSATPAHDTTRHSGIGRFSFLTMRPMTLWETGAGSGAISLHELTQSPGAVSAHSPLTYRDLAEAAARGGWPATLGDSTEIAHEYNLDYLDNLTRGAIAGVDEPPSPARIRRLIQAIARRLSGEEVLARLAGEVSQSAKPETIRKDLDYLQQVFAYEPLPAWAPALRSRSRLNKASKLHLVDPALAVAALDADPQRLAMQAEYFGQVFESMAIRDLRTYAEANRGSLYHYRDNTGLEIDAIIEYRTCWAAAEVKLGSHEIPKAESNLLKLRERVDPDSVGPAAFLAVITGTEYAYTLESGVHVIPLACLRE